MPPLMSDRNRNVDQPYKYVATWLIDEWSKIGLRVTQRVLPTGPFFEGLRNATFDVRSEPERRSALQVCRHLADRRMEQDRSACHAARAADGPVFRRAA